MKMMNVKKGQSEAFGLAIIMLLLIISAVIFLLRPHNNSNQTQEQAMQIMNDNYAFVLLYSNMKYGQNNECDQAVVYQAINDYGWHYQTDTLPCNSNQVNYYDAIYNYINETVNKTFVEWNQPFNLTITSPGADKNFSFGYPATGGCNGKNRIGAASYPLAGSTLTFYTC